LPDWLDWVWRPVLHPNINIRPIELYDGTYTIDQIADINEAIEIEAENMWRAHEAMSKRDGRS